MRPDWEIDRICRSLVSWHRYAPDVKADLFSTAVISNAGAYLIDAIDISFDDLRSAISPASIAAVVVTNENHARVSGELAAAFSVPLYTHAATRAALRMHAATCIADGEQFAPGLRAIAIEGAPAGEIAIHAEPDGGSLIIGDALINMGSYGFTFLPAKYCTNHKQMRRSLRKLLNCDFERIVFAHGSPIVVRAKERLTQLLES